MSKILFGLSKKKHSDIECLFFIAGASLLPPLFLHGSYILNALASLAYLGFVFAGSYLTGFIRCLAVDVSKKRHVVKQCEKLAKAIDDRKGDI